MPVPDYKILFEVTGNVDMFEVAKKAKLELLLEDLRDLRKEWLDSTHGAYYGESAEEASQEEGRISGKISCADDHDYLIEKYGTK